MSRRKFKNFLFTCTIVASSYALSIGSRGETRNASDESWSKLLTAGGQSELERAVQEAATERQSAIGVLLPLIQQVDEPHHRPQIAAAMKIAGNMRAAESVDLLLDKIDFLEFGTLPTSRPADASIDMLAVKTLIAIGIPAIDPIIKRISTEASDQRRLWLAVALKHILGTDCARLRLIQERDVARRNSSDTRRLDEAIKIIDNPVMQ